MADDALGLERVLEPRGWIALTMRWGDVRRITDLKGQKGSLTSSASSGTT